MLTHAHKNWRTDYVSHSRFIVERSGTDVDEALASLQQYGKSIWVISQVIQNDISSTKVRLFLKKDLSVRYVALTKLLMTRRILTDHSYLIPDPVVEVCCPAAFHTMPC